MNDDTLTIYFRRCLTSEGYEGIYAYEWYHDEPWYGGHPLDGRATEAEQRAIENTYKWASQQEERHAG